ncbi:hypothetical protein ACFWXB_16315 [Tsukamurella tyrosinosolvens]|uniref:hypothetical protein n=1 Tax=Tsukamurella tyrosinosolvens TaxID=57704 RepID=UPI003696ECDD
MTNKPEARDDEDDVVPLLDRPDAQRGAEALREAADRWGWSYRHWAKLIALTSPLWVPLAVLTRISVVMQGHGHDVWLVATSLNLGDWVSIVVGTFLGQTDLLRWWVPIILALTSGELVKTIRERAAFRRRGGDTFFIVTWGDLWIAAVGLLPTFGGLAFAGWQLADHHYLLAAATCGALLWGTALGYKRYDDGLQTDVEIGAIAEHGRLPEVPVVDEPTDLAEVVSASVGQGTSLVILRKRGLEIDGDRGSARTLPQYRYVNVESVLGNLTGTNSAEIMPDLSDVSKPVRIVATDVRTKALDAMQADGVIGEVVAVRLPSDDPHELRFVPATRVTDPPIGQAYPARSGARVLLTVVPVLLAIGLLQASVADTTFWLPKQCITATSPTAKTIGYVVARAPAGLVVVDDATRRASVHGSVQTEPSSVCPQRN